MNLQENIRRILKEETQGIDNFLDELSNTHPMSDELKSFVKKFYPTENFYFREMTRREIKIGFKVGP